MSGDGLRLWSVDVDGIREMRREGLEDEFSGVSERVLAASIRVADGVVSVDGRVFAYRGRAYTQGSECLQEL